MGANTYATSNDGVIRVITHATCNKLMSFKIYMMSKWLIFALYEKDRGRFVNMTDGGVRIIGWRSEFRKCTTSSPSGRER